MVVRGTGACISGGGQAHPQGDESTLEPKAGPLPSPLLPASLSPPGTRDIFPESQPGESASFRGDPDIQSPKGAVDGARLAGSQAPPWHQKTGEPSPLCSRGQGDGRFPGPSEPPLQKEGMERASFQPEPPQLCLKEAFWEPAAHVPR